MWALELVVLVAIYGWLYRMRERAMNSPKKERLVVPTAAQPMREPLPKNPIRDQYVYFNEKLGILFVQDPDTGCRLPIRLNTAGGGYFDVNRGNACGHIDEDEYKYLSEARKREWSIAQNTLENK